MDNHIADPRVGHERDIGAVSWMIIGVTVSTGFGLDRMSTSEKSPGCPRSQLKRSNDPA